jgi:DNA-binding response OmpR family regulator
MTTDHKQYIRALLLSNTSLARWAQRECLEKLDCWVTDVDTCEQAVRLWSRRGYDVIVLDHELPDGLGIDLIRRMRLDGYDEPVIYLTPESNLPSLELQQELEFTPIGSNPLNLEEFENTIRALSQTDSGGHATSRHATGQFHVISAPTRLSEKGVREIECAHKDFHWLAIDLSHTEHIYLSALPHLVRLADERRSVGGRLCLVGFSNQELDYHWKQWGLDCEIDVVPNISGLAAVSRRPYSICERASLLRSVIVERKR